MIDTIGTILTGIVLLSLLIVVWNVLMSADRLWHEIKSLSERQRDWDQVVSEIERAAPHVDAEAARKEVCEPGINWRWVWRGNEVNHEQ